MSFQIIGPFGDGAFALLLSGGTACKARLLLLIGCQHHLVPLAPSLLKEEARIQRTLFSVTVRELNPGRQYGSASEPSNFLTASLRTTNESVNNDTDKPADRKTDGAGTGIAAGELPTLSTSTHSQLASTGRPMPLHASTEWQSQQASLGCGTSTTTITIGILRACLESNLTRSMGEMETMMHVVIGPRISEWAPSKKKIEEPGKVQVQENHNAVQNK